MDEAGVNEPESFPELQEDWRVGLEGSKGGDEVEEDAVDEVRGPLRGASRLGEGSEGVVREDEG